MGSFNTNLTYSIGVPKNIKSEITSLNDTLDLPVFIFNEFGIIGGICAALAVLFSSHGIIMHLYFFNEPKLQLYIVRILLMVPVK